MESENKGFLDDTSLSKTPNSPKKTSTVAKEAKKWSKQNQINYDNTFSNDQPIPSGQDSDDSLQLLINKPLFNLRHEMEFGRANSSLGILSVDNISGLNESTMHLPVHKKIGMRNLLKKQDLVIEEVEHSKAKNSMVENKSKATNGCALLSADNPTKEDGSGSSSSCSDIEYDGTNIPELNSDYELPNDIKETFQMMKLPDFNPLSSNNAAKGCGDVAWALSGRHSMSKQQCKDKVSLKQRFSFTDYSPEYVSMYEKLKQPLRTSSKAFDNNDMSANANPFLDASSFNFNDIYGKEANKKNSLFETISKDDEQITKDKSSLNLRFCPDEISARSTSMGSSLKDSKTTKFSLMGSDSKASGNESEVIAGSEMVRSREESSLCRLAFGLEYDQNDEISRKASEPDFMQPRKQSSCTESLFPAEFSRNGQIDFTGGPENWMSRLGLSENEFFSAEDAREMLNQREESFKKANMFKIGDAHDINEQNQRVSSWSTTNLRNEITLPSWMEPNSSVVNSADRRISIGQFMQAKTEALGSSLSEDPSNRERPFFGVDVQTPPRRRVDRDSRMQSIVEISETAKDNSDDESVFSSANSSKAESKARDVITESCMSRLFSELSTESPVTIANKFLELFPPKDQLTTPALPREEPESLSIPNRPPSECSSSCSENTASLHSATQRPTSSLNTLASECCLHNNPSVRDASSVASFPVSHWQQSCATCHRNNVVAIPEVQQQVPFQARMPLYMPGVISNTFIIHGPSELSYPDHICVNDTQNIDLTLQNPSSVPCVYHLNLLYASINGCSVIVKSSGVVVPNMIHSTGINTTVQISLSPQYKGKHHVELQAAATFQSVEQTHFKPPVVCTKIYFEAEKPQVELRSNGETHLNLGTVVAGSTVSCSVTVINRGAVSVPLRLSIPENIRGLCFAMQEMKLLSNIEECRFLTHKVLTCRLPASSTTFNPEFDIPLLFESGNSTYNVNGVISASIEHPIISDVMANLTFSCSVAEVEIVLKDLSQKMLLMEANENARSTQTVVVINKGSIPVMADLAMVGEENTHFTVSPQTLQLEPSQSSNVIITFHPTPSSSHCQVLKSMLEAAAQPHGKVFKITEVVGKVRLIPAADQVTMLPSVANTNPQIVEEQLNINARKNVSSVLVCDKQYLEWGGVNVGETVTKQIKFRNTLTEPLKVMILLKSNSGCFKLKEQPSCRRRGMQIMLSPNEEKPFAVTYSPVTVELSSGMLCLKAEARGQPIGYSVTLNGYGGLSNLKLIGMQVKEGLGYFLNINTPHHIDTVYHNVKFHNVGCRPAFIKLLYVSDSDCSDITVQINPSEFILLENESKTVFATFNISRAVNSLNVANFGAIVVYSGDEIMRQKYKRLTVSAATSQTLGEPLRRINFNVPYAGEDRISNDPQAPTSPMDCALFYSQLCKQLIHICRGGVEDLTLGRMSFGPLSVIQDTFCDSMFDATLSSRHTLAAETPVKDTQGPAMSRFSLQAQSSRDNGNNMYFMMSKLGDLWSVSPENLMLDTNTKDCRLLLSNHSTNDLKFKLEWTVNVISVSPVQGVVAAGGQIGLRVKLIPHRLASQRGDCVCFIKVFCSNIEKIVHVEVFKGSSLPKLFNSSSNMSTNESLKSMFLTDINENCSEHDTNASCSEPKSCNIVVEDIRRFPPKICLQSSSVGICSETVLTVHNTNQNAIQWTFHSISPAMAQTTSSYEKNIPIITVLPSTGVLQPSESTDIVIKFLPSCSGFFYQFFEVSTECTDGSNKKEEVQIEGSASENSALSFVTDHHKGDGKFDTSSCQNFKGNVFVASEVLQFPSTTPGKSVRLGLSVKNTTKQDYKVFISKPDPPFAIKHHCINVKSNKFVTLPIYFKPVTTSSAPYESMLFLECDNGKMQVRLVGSCTLEK